MPLRSQCPLFWGGRKALRCQNKSAENLFKHWVRNSGGKKKKEKWQEGMLKIINKQESKVFSISSLNSSQC